MPRVSVIIPTYNRADVLPRAIDSVLGQTETDLELLVIDDGSTDDTQDLLKTYGDSRLRSKVHGVNRGANVARNTGIELARGTYVAFLDSDDEWLPTKLERQLTELDKRNEGWVAAYCDFAIRSKGVSGRVQTAAAKVLSSMDTAGTKEGGEELVGEILADNVHPGAGSTLLVRTDIAREIGGFDETLNRFQDPEFVIRILGKGKLAYVNEPLVIRHKTPNPNADVVKAASGRYLSTYSDTIEQLEAKGFDIHGSHNLVLAKQYYREGNFVTGTRKLSKASIRPRQFPGVVWAFSAGVRRRPKPAIVLVSLLILVLFIWGSVFS